MHHQKNSELTEVKEIKTYSLILSLQFPPKAAGLEHALSKNNMPCSFHRMENDHYNDDDATKTNSEELSFLRSRHLGPQDLLRDLRFVPVEGAVSALQAAPQEAPTNLQDHRGPQGLG